MNKFQYKERDHAKEIEENGFTSKYIVSELKILAKYYKEQGKDEESVKILLKDFCKKHLKGYNEAVHFKIINNAVAFGMKDENKIIQIDQIDVNQSELEIINQMDIDYEYKRVIFTLLILTKLNKEYVRFKDGEIKSIDYYFGGHKNYRELVLTSKTTFKKNKKSKVKNIHDLIHILDDKGIVEITGNGKIKLLFMYNIMGSDDAIINIEKFNSVGLYFDLYNNVDKVASCSSCGIPIKKKNNSQRFCDSCRDDYRRKYKTEKQREYRENIRVDTQE